MANGPLGGNMGTPPVPPQPPQVSFETTAQSRGNFNNFLKSMPNTTSMTPIPPMGSSPMMPAPDPMASIDIFNQPVNMRIGGLAGNPLDSYGDYLSQQIDSTQVEPFIQEVQQMASQRFNLGSGGQSINASQPLMEIAEPLPQPSIFQRIPQQYPQDLSRPNMEGEPLLSIFNPDDFLRKPEINAFQPFNSSQIQAMTQRPAAPFQMQGLGQPMRDKDGILREPIGLRGGAEMFGNIGSLPRTFFNGGEVDDSDFGGFSDYGSVDATSDDGFSEDNDVSDYSTDDSGVYTGDDSNNQDVALPTPRPEILKEAIARAENEVFGGSESDALGFFNKAGGLTDAGQKEYDSAIMANLDLLQDERPADTGTQLANVFDNQDILSASTKNVNPADIVQASFRPGSLNSTFGGNVLDGLDLNTAFGQNRTKTDPNVTGSTDAELAAMDRAIANTQRVTDREKQLANVNNQTLADRLQNQRGLDRDISTIPDTALETMIDRRDVFQPDNIGTGQQPVDTALETMAGRIGPVDTVFDIDTRDTRNFVGDDFESALNLTSRNEADRLAAGQAMGVGTAPNLQNLTSTAMGRGQNVTRSIAPEDFEEKVGRDFNANRMADIERLYGEDVGQTKAGRGSDPTFFEDKGFTGTAGGILDAIERKTRENMANEIALGRPMGLGETFFGFNAPDLRTQTMKDYMSNVQPNYDFGDFNQTSKSIPEKQLVRNNSGRVIGIRDASGRLVSGMDPNAPMDTGDDNNENPFIIKPKAEEEEKEEEDKPPNVIGGGDPITPPTPKSVVVDSPFTSNVSDFVPSTFNTGDINKLIEMLTGVPAPKSMKKGGVAGYAEGGRVMQALDNLLATA